MKKNLLLTMFCLLAFLSVNVTRAQVPEKFKYQAVLRDASGNIIPNTAETVVVKIYQTAPSGVLVYQETQNITTTAQGVINLDIGAGTVNFGTFANIYWGVDNYYVNVSIGGTDISTGQLLSVPFALSVKGITRNPMNGYVGIGVALPENLLDLYGTGARENITLKSNNATFGPELRLISTAANGHEWRAVSGSISNTYGAGSFELWDQTAGKYRFGITSNGNVGIGTSAPAAKLDVAGTVRIADGSQANGRILSCDANGTGTWVSMSGVTPAVMAVLTNTPNNITSLTGAYTGSTLTLPPGKWSVQIAIIASEGDGNLACWIRTGLSTSTSTFVNADVVGPSLASGYKASGAYSMIIGTIIINNTSGANKTYYYWTGGPQVYSGTYNLPNFGTSLWGENAIVAYPMN